MASRKIEWIKRGARIAAAGFLWSYHYHPVPALALTCFNTRKPFEECSFRLPVPELELMWPLGHRSYDLFSPKFNSLPRFIYTIFREVMMLAFLITRNL